MLEWFEEFDQIEEATQREKSMKRYLRAWKINPYRAVEPAMGGPVSGAGGT
jgi:predicted GIY-YIG superfamily endonuclease